MEESDINLTFFIQNKLLLCRAKINIFKCVSLKRNHRTAST